MGRLGCFSSFRIRLEADQSRPHVDSGSACPAYWFCSSMEKHAHGTIYEEDWLLHAIGLELLRRNVHRSQ